jgi:uncharacterized protein
MPTNEPVQVAVMRTVKSGREKEFEQALHDFVQRSLALPGQLGVSIIRPAPGSTSRQYGIIRKFSDRNALVAFRTSTEYLQWNQLTTDLTEGSGHVEELCGLESWFTLPGETLRPLPKWKMAIATYLGVLPVVLFLNVTLGRLIRGWNFILSNVVFNACVVALLTWLVMPAITRVLHGWLQPKQGKTQAA